METSPSKCLWSCCCRQAEKEPSSEELCELFLLFNVICTCSISSQLLHSHLFSELLFTGNNYSVFSLPQIAITLLPGDSLVLLITFHSKKYWEKKYIHMEKQALIFVCIIFFHVNKVITWPVHQVDYRSAQISTGFRINISIGLSGYKEQNPDYEPVFLLLLSIYSFIFLNEEKCLYLGFFVPTVQSPLQFEAGNTSIAGNEITVASRPNSLLT